MGAGPEERSTSPDLDLPIEALDLTERPRNCLKRAQINTIGELVSKTEEDLLGITNFGEKSLQEVLQRLDDRGLSLARGAGARAEAEG
jgi:DNA-directed RNA polymerase subunit alpha